MENAKKDKTIIDKVWDIFSSIKLAVIVFTIISATSIVGTIVEQDAEPERNIKLLTKFFGDSAPSALKILDGLGFTNMFHSWWFIALLFAFAANLIICSLDRLPGIMKLVKDPIKPLPQNLLASMPIKREVVLKGKADKAAVVVESAVKAIGFKPALHQEEDGIQIYAEKGRYSRLGVYVTHLSILLIFVGAIIGVFFGFNASLNLLEGTQSEVAYGKNGKEIPLGFGVGCEDFDVSFYENSDTPKSFRSRLVLIENGQAVKINGKEITEIEVNTPLKYKGITFYQSSYGFSPGKDSIFKFAVTANDGKKEEVQLKYGGSFVIPGTAVTGKILDFSPAIAVDPSGKIITYAEMMHNPAVLIEFSENGKQKYTQWILKRFANTWKVQDGTVEFRDLWGSQYTGLQVRKDPGVWIVYLGCMIMAAGLYGAFFMSHARLWIMLKEGKNDTKVVIAASSNKNRLAFENRLDKLIKTLGH